MKQKIVRAEAHQYRVPRDVYEFYVPVIPHIARILESRNTDSEIIKFTRGRDDSFDDLPVWGCEIRRTSLIRPWKSLRNIIPPLAAASGCVGVLDVRKRTSVWENHTLLEGVVLLS